MYLCGFWWEVVVSGIRLECVSGEKPYTWCLLERLVNLWYLIEGVCIFMVSANMMVYLCGFW